MSNDSALAREHDRRSIRLTAYDYRGAGAYFVTIVTANRACIFGQIIDGAATLTELGHAVEEEWSAIAIRHEQVRLDEVVVMPNHIHGVIWITGDGRTPDEGTARHAPTPPRFSSPRAGSLGTIVGQLKAAVTKRGAAWQMHSPVWQRNFYEHVIRNDAALQRIRKYIVDNPARWPDDEENPNCGAG